MSSPIQSMLPLRDALARARELSVAGNLGEAERWLHAIIAVKPGHFETLYLLAIVTARSGRLEQALHIFDRALAVDAGSAKAHTYRGAMLRGLGRLDEALASCDRAIGIDDSFADAHRNRAAILKDIGRKSDALASCDRALALAGDSPESHNIRGAVLQDLGRHGEAIMAYDRALELRPDFAEALSNRAGVRSTLKDFRQALADSERALALRPALADAHYHRGLALTGLLRHADAEASYRQALVIRPELPGALVGRAGALAYLRRHDEAIRDLERALEIDPDIEFAKGMLLEARMHCCDWREFDARRAEVIADVRAGKRAIDPFVFLAISDSAEDQLRCARIAMEAWHPPAGRATGTVPRHRSRVHVAYLSGDFREHAVAFLAAGLFECHDRTRFEVSAVSYGASEQTPMRSRLEKAFERFVDVRGRSDAEIAATIRDMDVDILVDLGGLTGSGSPGIVALRPAPLQVNFLGYTGTMGAPYVDYIVADSIVIPPGEKAAYAEQVAYLPDSFQVNDSRRIEPISSLTRRDAGLPDEGFVFCCFNNAFKIAPSIFALWMRLLRSVDGSVLWLLEGNALAVANLRKEAEAAGVARERLVFATKMKPEDHIGRHLLADLFLDTLPFNAHTTASDALWAGVPVLTCEGTTFAGRVAASLLHAAHAPELVTRSLADYEAKAIHLATCRDQLELLGARLKVERRTMPLFDTARFCRHLESAYTMMWERCVRGEAPTAFSVAPAGTTAASV